MKFVFTLRGSEAPIQIHIQIMTLAGTVVRDITKTDLGNVHIGDNISDFTWDGTDQIWRPFSQWRLFLSRKSEK
jgi:hypothetical protein